MIILVFIILVIHLVFLFMIFHEVEKTLDNTFELQKDYRRFLKKRGKR